MGQANEGDSQIMITPSMRKEARRIDRHHMNFRHKEWVHASDTHRQVRELGAFILHLPRHWHDRIHLTVEPLTPPPQKVAGVLLDIGIEHELWEDDTTRITSMVDDMAGFTRTEPSPETADYMLEAMTNYSAQLGVLTLARSMK